ncbi:MAG TPA: hypothetical protein DDW76_18695 [Cyanobacteria bacterium UBA11369]|nr:hypothetical protein [Cyanobacteria bacterium UBA11371]HBE37086.1 hypothetical protein [Cyanobacteria bacterium UBA11368]HBE50741.1 hypothetical protein [Cyanobacteria bacterium UBA11369]
MRIQPKCMRLPISLFCGNSLVTILVLMSLSVLSLRITSSAATTVDPKNTEKSEEIHIAQAAEIVNCEVSNIRTGQLALRFSPNGRSRAGLDNGNLVRFIDRRGIWFYVRVLEGPNPRVNGLEGWVNSNYLECFWD